MKEYLKRLKRGEFEYSIPQLLEIQPINEEVLEKTVFEKSIPISATEKIIGTAITNNNLVFANITYEKEAPHLSYRVDTNSTKPDENISGEITLLTNAGRILVPFSFKVIKRKISVNDFVVEDIDSFLTLAKKDERLAASIFKTEEFRIVVLKDDYYLNALYNQYIKVNNFENGFSCFLASLVKQEDEKEEIKKEEEKSVTKPPFSSFTHNLRNAKINITKDYIDFRTNKMSLDEFIKRAEQYIFNKDLLDSYKMLKEEEYSYLEMLVAKAFILALKNNTEEALQILNANAEKLLEDKEKDGVLYYTAMYIRFICERAETNFIKEAFENAMDNRNIPWQILIYQYHLDENATNNASIWLTRFKDAFSNGCNSPLIYLEAIRIINKSPELLRVLNAFEIQVIRFGYKYHLVEYSATQRFSKLVFEENKLTYSHIKSLKALYDEYNSDEILSTLCQKLIADGLTGVKYAKIYEQAIKRGLKITRLYEHYLLSIYGTNVKKIPETVLRYFVYENFIDNNVKAFLYAHIVGLEEENPEIFLLYKKDIATFTKERLQKTLIDEYLIVLYRWIATKRDLIDKSIALFLFKLRYTYQITVEDENLNAVCVRNVKLNIEKKIPITDKKVYAFILSNAPFNQEINNEKENVICFEDARGIYYPENVISCTYERVLNEKIAIKYFDEACSQEPFFDLYRYEKSIRENDINTALRYAKCLLMMEILPTYFKKDVRKFIEENNENIVVNSENIEMQAIKSDKLKLLEIEEELTKLLFTKESVEKMKPLFAKLLTFTNEGLVYDAYIAYNAFLYFVKKEDCDESIFNCIMERLKSSKRQLPVELAALLKASTKKEEISEEDLSFYQKVLDAFIDKEMYFSFYGNLHKKLNLPFFLNDKTIVEYTGLPNENVYISLNDKEERLKETFCGIYTYTLILFEKEKVSYEIISYDEKENKNVLEDGVIYEKTLGKNKPFMNPLYKCLNADRNNYKEKKYLSYLEEKINMDNANKKLFIPI